MAERGGSVVLLIGVETIDVIYGIALFAVLLVIPGTITLMKGQNVLFALGLLLAGIIWMITALRLARPDSYWARKFYGEAKLARARQRYGGD